MDQTRAWKAVLVLLLGLATVTALSLALGSVPLSLQQLSQALLRQGEALPQTILWQLRFPRGLAAIVVGAALGTSGALMQGLLRNPLATPFLLGISAGAGLVVVAIVTLSLPPTLLPVGAWCGSVVAAAIVYALGRSSMGLSLERLILGGVSVSTLFSAIQTNLLLRAEEGRTQLALNWLFGSLSGRGWSDLQLAGPYILIALILACDSRCGSGSTSWGMAEFGRCKWIWEIHAAQAAEPNSPTENRRCAFGWNGGSHHA